MQFRRARLSGEESPAPVNQDERHQPEKDPTRIKPIASQTAEPVSWCRPSPANAITSLISAALSSANTARTVGSEADNAAAWRPAVSMSHGWGHGSRVRASPSPMVSRCERQYLSPPDFLDEPSGNGALNGIPVQVTAAGLLIGSDDTQP